MSSSTARQRLWDLDTLLLPLEVKRTSNTPNSPWIPFYPLKNTCYLIPSMLLLISLA